MRVEAVITPHTVDLSYARLHKFLNLSEDEVIVSVTIDEDDTDNPHLVIEVWHTSPFVKKEQRE